MAAQLCGYVKNNHIIHFVWANFMVYEYLNIDVKIQFKSKTEFFKCLGETTTVNERSGQGSRHLHRSSTIQKQQFSHSDWHAHHTDQNEVYPDVKVKHIYLFMATSDLTTLGTICVTLL